MISVVMPAYNAARYIGQAIDSLLNQTYKDFELLVIDDCSTDDTVEIVKAYAAKDPRVRLIQQPANGGVSVARNTGFQEAKYPWVALLDADDIALPDRLEKQVKAIESDPEVVAWGAAVRNMSPDGKPREIKEVGPPTKEVFYQKREKGEVIFLATTASVLRRDLVLKVNGYDLRFKASEDTDLVNRIADYGAVVALREPLVLYRLHSSGLSARKFLDQYINTHYLEARSKARLAGKTLDYDEFLKQYHAQPLPRRFLRHMDMMSKLQYRNAGVYLSKGNTLRGGGLMLMAFLYNPTVITQRVWGKLRSLRRQGMI